jgi:hypothetical protein
MVEMNVRGRARGGKVQIGWGDGWAGVEEERLKKYKSERV